MTKTFDYKDINLVPEKCIVDSRQECDTSINIKNYKFKNFNLSILFYQYIKIN